MTPKALIAPARLAGTPLLRTQTDERLVDLVRAGNDQAFEAIVARYRAPLLRYCSRLLGDGRAEDALQQTFLRAYNGLHASSREMHLKPWLFRIAHNVTINVLRDRGSRYEELSEQIDGVERPDQAHEKAERLREVVAAVGTLPARQRDALLLRELEGRSYDEIATSLGVSDGAVRQLLNRARTTLRAGVTAVTPTGLLTRLPWAQGWGEESSARVAELCGGAAAGTLVAKVCTTALLTGAIVGGVATTPQHGDERGVAAGSADAAPPRPERSGAAPPQGLRRATAASGSAASAQEDRSRRRRGRRDGSGRRSEGEDARSNSGPGSGDGGHGGDSGEDGDDSSSGSGSVSSWPGSSGSGSQDPHNSGSGSGSSGPDVPEIERSGSGTSGSGTSGSGSESPDSDTDGDSSSSGSGG